MEIKDHKKFYREEFHRDAPVDSASIGHHRAWLSRIGRLLPERAGATALDFGCDLGQFQPALAERFETVVAADISETSVRKAAALGENSFGAALDGESGFPFRDNSFDVVFAFEVLEHLREPGHAVGELMRILKPGGTLVTLQQYRLDGWAKLYERLNRLRGRGAAGRDTLEDKHISQYDPAGWVKLVTGFGFSLRARVATSVLPPVYYIGDTGIAPLRALGGYLRNNFYSLPVISLADRALCRVGPVADLAALSFIYVFRKPD